MASLTGVIWIPAAASLADDMMQLLRGVCAAFSMKSLSFLKNLNSLLQTPARLNQLDDLSGGDIAGVGDIVGAERNVFFPASEGYSYEFV